VGCPNYDEEEYESSGLDYWRDACTVGASAAFSGYVYSRDRGEWVNGAYAYTHDAYYRGSARMVDARGYVFVGAGYSNHSEYTNTSTGDVTVYSSLNGNFRTDDPAYAGTWLAQDLNVSVYTSAVDYAEDEFITDGFSMVTSASLSGIDGVINALRLNNLYMYSESIGSPCEIEPSGSVEIRDNAGHWYQIHFQGPEYAGAPTFPPDCDACGPVYFHGELLGEVCPDFSDLGAWEVRPW
jgi:hypothetical protein